MKKVFAIPEIEVQYFLKDAIDDGYSMQEELILPSTGDALSKELGNAGYLEDYTELISTDVFEEKGMRISQLIHDRLNKAVSRVEGNTRNNIPLFSVRVFESGQYGTTVHRNHPCIGPWAIGLTLRGEAPFNVYRHDQLEFGETLPLVGNSQDPVPLDSMDAGAGSAWSLYTNYEQVPHSSGLVETSTQRELLIFYGMH